jgi:hypothetical protein
MEQKVPKHRKGSLRESAKKHRVSHATLRRSVQFFHAVNTIAASVEEQPEALLTGEIKIGRQEWQALAEIAEAQPDAAKKVLAQIRTARTMKVANRIVRLVHEAAFGTKCSTKPPSVLDQICRLLPKLTFEERVILMHLLFDRDGNGGSAASFTRNFRELISKHREEIKARPHIHRWKPYDACYADQIQLLNDVEQELDLLLSCDALETTAQ